MIDFSYSELQDNVRQMVHWFAENEVRPIALAADRTHRIPDEFIRKVKEIGLSMGPVPKEVGGEGGGAGEKKDKKGTRQNNRLSVIGAEEMAWGDPAVILCLPGPGLGGPPVNIMGTKEQKERFLGIFTRPEPLWGAYGLTEPGAGSDVAGIRTTAVKDGDHYLLNGTKCFITNGARASWVVVFATVDRSKGRAGHRAFMVEKGTPGFSVGKLEEKMGLRASETAELVLDNVRVHQDNLLGGEAYYEGKEGFMGAMKTFDSTRPMVAAMAVGIARAAYERAVEFAKEHFELGRPIGRYHYVQELLARSKRRIDASRLLVYRAAWMADAELPNAKEASMSKAYAARTAVEVLSDVVQVMGAAGVVHDHFVEKWFRDIKVYDIFEGTGEIQRIVISKRILKDLKSF
ncbi:MAG: acyl-CoA dehydrogenase family protein [Myxococcales bacterium]|nr:acyl-CoA dehydrogenase family protein [Myxococcales bacterium]